MSIEALLCMTNRYGENEEFVLSSGGNTSYKNDDVMYITCSGSKLAAVTGDDLVAMNTQELRKIVSHTYPPEMNAIDAEKESYRSIIKAKTDKKDIKRPSVESIMHALFPYKYVLHLHPALVNGLTCSVEFEKNCKELFPQAVCVGVMPPGPGLARLCKTAIDKCAVCPRIVFLQNHGIIIAADDTGEIDDIMTSVTDKLTSVITCFPDLTQPGIVEKYAEIYKIHDNPLTPEQVIYPDDESLIRNAVKIAVYAQSFGGINPLPDNVIKSMKEFNPYD